MFVPLEFYTAAVDVENYKIMKIINDTHRLELLVFFLFIFFFFVRILTQFISLIHSNTENLKESIEIFVLLIVGRQLFLFIESVLLLVVVERLRKLIVLLLNILLGVLIGSIDVNESLFINDNPKMLWLRVIVFFKCIRIFIV
jgi:hypothetical protein